MGGGCPLTPLGLSATQSLSQILVAMSEAYRMRSVNTILVKDDVGKAKPSCYDLPHEAFAFGRAEPADMEGAREVTMHWAAHVPRPKQNGNVQDFRKINRMAAKANVANAKELIQFKSGV